jgi:hypothetical protein
MSSTLEDARDLSLANLAAATDAAFPGDPLGTDIKASYMQNNVSAYIQVLAKAIMYSKHYFVHPTYGAALESPFFANIDAAHTQVKTDGSGSSNKAHVDIKAIADSYTDALTLNHNGYIVMKGVSKRNCIISGNATISTGIYVFDNLKITGNLVITGGIALFPNCLITGTIAQSGGSTLMLHNCENAGVITLSGNNNVLWVENVANIEKDGSSKSIILPAGMTGGTYEIRDSYGEGTLDDADKLAKCNNWSPSSTARPNH